MSRLLRFLIVGLVAGFPVYALLVADVVVVPDLERRLAGAAAQGGPGEATVDISGFPVAARALSTGSVRKVTFEWSDAKLGPVRGAVRLELRGIQLRRGGLLSGEVLFEGVESGGLDVLIRYEQLERVIALEIDPNGGNPTVALSPAQSVPLTFSASPTSLVLAPQGFDPVTVVLGGRPLPCAPKVDAEVSGLNLSCPFRGVPGFLRP